MGQLSRIIKSLLLRLFSTCVYIYAHGSPRKFNVRVCIYAPGSKRVNFIFHELATNVSSNHIPHDSNSFLSYVFGCYSETTSPAIQVYSFAIFTSTIILYAVSY